MSTMMLTTPTSTARGSTMECARALVISGHSTVVRSQVSAVASSSCGSSYAIERVEYGLSFLLFISSIGYNFVRASAARAASLLEHE